MNKFEKGDLVKVVNYGHPILISLNSEINPDYPIIHEYDGMQIKDMNSDIIGLSGIVDKVDLVQGKYKYAISGIPEKYAWYNERQLELIKKG